MPFCDFSYICLQPVGITSTEAYGSSSALFEYNFVYFPFYYD